MTFEGGSYFDDDHVSDLFKESAAANPKAATVLEEGAQLTQEGLGVSMSGEPQTPGTADSKLVQTLLDVAQKLRSSSEAAAPMREEPPTQQEENNGGKRTISYIPPNIHILKRPTQPYQHSLQSTSGASINAPLSQAT
ncbi:hypothetical protein HZA38_03375 [Candidatus Peregrinibacteria bacterium]|nr:hypothetical protein [Candidatus Peregrinibacteria bacterium]